MHLHLDFPEFGNKWKKANVYVPMGWTGNYVEKKILHGDLGVNI